MEELEYFMDEKIEEQDKGDTDGERKEVVERSGKQIAVALYNIENIEAKVHPECLFEHSFCTFGKKQSIDDTCIEKVVQGKEEE